MNVCIRIYNSGDFVRHMIERTDEMEEWVAHTMKWRPGQAVVVNGEIKWKGYLDEARINERVAEINKIAHTGPIYR